MALRTGASVRTGTRPSREEVQSAALQQLQNLGTVSTPTERLGTAPVEQQVPIAQPQGGAPVAPSASQVAQQQIHAADLAREASQQVAQANPQLAQLRSLRPQQSPSDVTIQPGETAQTDLRNVISSKVSTSPAAQDVLRTEVPVGVDETGQPLFKTSAEKLTGYRTELEKQRLPGYERDILPHLESKEADVDFFSDFDFDRDIDTFSFDEDVSRTEIGFLENSKRLASKFESKAAKTPRVAEVLRKAGIADANGNIDGNAVGALMFTVGVEKGLNDIAKNDEVQRLNEEIDAGRLSEKDLEKNKLYGVLQTPLDRQNLQSSLFPRFQQIYKGLDDPSNPAATPGTFTDRSRFETSLSKQDQAIFTAATMDLLEDMGFVTAVRRKDPSTGKERIGYEPTSTFTNVYGSIENLLGEYNNKLTVDVSLAPLVDGVPVGHAAAQHKQLTKADPRVRLKKGDPVLNAMDIAGRTPWKVNEDAFTGNALYLSQVLSTDKDPVFGFYNHPFASFFLLDSKTFMKHVKPSSEIQKDYELEVKQFETVAGRTDVFEPPYISEYSKRSYNSIEELQRVYAELLDAGEFDAQAKRDLDDFVKRVIRPARQIQKSVSGGYTKDILDAARLKENVFYYPQRAQAGTTRIQLGTSTLSYQNSKKARGLVSNPISYVVKGRKLSDIISEKAPENRQQVVLEAMIARNFEEGGKALADAVTVSDPKTGKAVKPSRLKDIKLQQQAFVNGLKSNPEIAEIAKFVSLTTDAMKGEASQWATASQEFIKGIVQTNNLSANQVKPQDFQNFPKVNTLFDPIQYQANINKLAEFMGLGSEQSDGTWKPGGKSDHADFVYNTFKTLGDYLLKGDTNGVFETNLTAEIDGIASGLTIQGYQFGDENYLKHGGVLYDGLWTTPEGDIRDMIQKSITGGVVGGQKVLDNMGYDDFKKGVMEQVYQSIQKAGKSKDLHKAAAMTVAYSQEPKAAAKNSVENYKSATVNTDLQKELEGFASKLNLTYDELINEMIEVEAKAVGMSLGTSVQMAEAVYQAGLFAGVVNEPYVYKLTNGHEMFLSGVKYVEAGPSETYIDESGKERFITTRETISDPTQKAESFGDYERESGSKVGKTAAVLPTQGIDAEIAQRTLIAVHNKLPQFEGGTRREGQNYAWTGQVFDAFIVDLGSYETTRLAANEQFLAVNRNSDQAQQHLDAVKRLKSELQKKVKQYKAEGKKFQVRPGGEYAGAFEAFRDLDRRVKKILRSEKLGNLGVVDKARLRKFTDFLRQKVKFDPNTGNDMTPEQFYAASEAYLAATNIEGILGKIGTQNRNGRKAIEEKIRQQEFDGRPVVQYG